MKHLIAYVHFLGFFPALYITHQTTPDAGAVNFIFAAIFSWSLLLLEVVKLWVL